jgi:parvulin-like peptidyl-prolyl isomerase
MHSRQATERYCGTLCVLLFVASGIALFASGCGRGESDADEEKLATVGDRTIRVEEFVHRAELSIRPPEIARPTEENKKALLDLLVAEKLMANEAERRGLHRDPLLQKLVANVEARAVIRELYKEEVKAQVEIREEELRQAYTRSNTTLSLRYLRTDDPEQAERWRRELQEGRDFLDILAESLGGPVDDSTQVAELRWGETDPALEDAAYQLRQIGEVSDVVRSQGAFYILQLVNAATNPLLTESGFQARRSTLTTVLRARKETVRSAEFVRDFMRGKNVVLKGRAFGILASELERYVDFQPGGDSSLNPKFDSLTELEFEQSQERLADHLDDPLITYKGGQWTIREALEKMWLIGMPLDRRSRGAFVSSLRGLLKNMVRDEFLAKEGYRRGLQKRQSVRREVEMWRDYYLFTMLRRQLRQTDGLSDLRPFVEELKRKYPVTVHVDRLADIQLTSIQMMAVRPGYISELAVPMWSQLVLGRGQ